MTHEEVIMSEAMIRNGIDISVVEDEDGFEVSVSSYITNKKRTLRYDAMRNKPGYYVRYDVNKKPTGRTHELVEVGDNPTFWVYDNLNYYINLVNKG